MRAPVCERRWTPVRGPGRGSRDSFVRSVAVRPNAEGGGLARRPGARVRDWVGDGADVWRNQFGSQCVGNERTRGAPAPRLRTRVGGKREPFLANHELKNSRVRRHRSEMTEIRPALFQGRGTTCRHFWTARHGVASTSPSSLGRRHRRCRCVDPRGCEPWIPGQSPRPTGAPVVRDPDDERAPRWLFQPPLTTPFIHPPLDRTARGRRL